DDEQTRVGPGQRAAGAAVPGAGDRFGVGEAGPAQCGEGVGVEVLGRCRARRGGRRGRGAGAHARTPFATGVPMTAVISSVAGIAVEHSRRVATTAPATLAKRSRYSRSQPASSPWHRAPPKPSPAPRPLTTST